MATLLRIYQGRHCPKCGQPYHYQLHRSWLVKNLLPFMDLKKQFCAKCKKSFYTRGINTDQEV